MEWLWQGIITSFVCFIISKFFNYLRNCFKRNSPDVYNKTDKILVNLWLKIYFTSTINAFIMCLILAKSDFKYSVKYSFLVICIYTANNLFAYYSVDNYKTQFFNKKAKYSTNKNTYQKKI